MHLLIITDKMTILTKELGWPFLFLGGAWSGFKPDNIKEVAGWYENGGLYKRRHINVSMRLSNFLKLF